MKAILPNGREVEVSEPPPLVLVLPVVDTSKPRHECVQGQVSLELQGVTEGVAFYA